jgi:hypothetical protein
MMDDDDSGRRVDLEALRKEAHSLGVHYTGDSGAELAGLISIVRVQRGTGPVRCYGLSYDPTDPRCRICDLRNPCADLDKRPRVEVMQVQAQFLQEIPCAACGAGLLNQDLLDPDTRRPRDYGCSTKGCQNTVSVQCGFSRSDLARAQSPVVTEIVLGEPAELAVVDGAPPVTAAPVLRIVRTPKPRRKSAKAAPPASPASPASPAPPVQAPVPARRRGRPPRAGLQFSYGGVMYSNVTAVLAKIVGKPHSANMARMFGVSLAELKAGQVLRREFKGVTHEVTVHEVK